MDALLTDAASRNLKIEGMIVTSLESDHEPVHLLCKSYSVEKLDASNLNVLSQVENSINQRHKLEDITPPLKSFFFSWEKDNSRSWYRYLNNISFIQQA